MPQCHASGAKVSKDTPEDQGPGGSKLRTLAVDLGELAGFILLVQNSHLARFAKWLVPAPSHVHWNSIHDFGEFFHFLAKSFLGNQRPSTTFKAWHDFTGFASGKGEIPQELGRTACSTSTQEHYILKNLQLLLRVQRASCLIFVYLWGIYFRAILMPSPPNDSSLQSGCGLRLHLPDLPVSRKAPHDRSLIIIDMMAGWMRHVPALREEMNKKW